MGRKGHHQLEQILLASKLPISLDSDICCDDDSIVIYNAPFTFKALSLA